MLQKAPMAKNKRNSDLSEVSKVLQSLLAKGKSPLSDGFLRWKLWRFWPDVVGETLGKICEPVGYERGRLYIWVKSSARMQELRFFEDTIRDKVNEYVGRKWVYSVRFTLDRKGIPTTEEASDQLKDNLAQENQPE